MSGPPTLVPAVPRTALPGVEQLTLANGMRSILQMDRRLPLVAVHLCHPAGSSQDPPGRSGLAHLSEHLAFRGREDRSGRALPDWIRQAGGVCRASTFQDTTAFTSTLPAQSLCWGLWVEAERMRYGRHQALEPEAVALQLRIIAQERHERIDSSPYGRSFELLHRMLYPAAHPYHRLPAGSAEEISSLSASDVEGFLGRHYGGEGSVLVLTGDLDPDAARHEIERFFGPAVEKRGESPTAAPLEAPPPPGPCRQEVTDPVPEARVYLAFQGPGLGRPGWHAAALLMRSLAVGRQSLLYCSLVETGTAREISTQMLAMRQASTLVLTATAAPGVSTQRLEDAMVHELESLLEGGLPEPLLARARKKALTDHFWTVQRLGRRAEQLATLATFFGTPGLLAAEGEHWLSVGPEAVTRIGREICQADRRVVLAFSRGKA